MNWGNWIFVAFVLFTIFIGTLAVICMRQDVFLVSATYYADELRYQEQINKEANTQALTDKPELSIVDNQLQLHYTQLANMEGGSLTLFRPSDAALDRYFELKLSNETNQYFTISDMPTGLYKAKLQWQEKGKEYYLEKIIIR